MTKKEAYKLKPGDVLEAVHAVPGQVGRVIFSRIIPKVTVRRKEYRAAWQDGHDEMIFGRLQNGERAWLNIGNARKV